MNDEAAAVDATVRYEDGSLADTGQDVGHGRHGE